MDALLELVRRVTALVLYLAQLWGAFGKKCIDFFYQFYGSCSIHILVRQLNVTVDFFHR